ncbi:hypothetical protein [Achromobacter mucicolens]|uniref:hypothetical protein n=1 Tax=Achromobacter mucicolens TaxID=1389922 RepID=UPI00100812B9|nr:hypothetical protein [Achromobacter mucicolens]
MEDHVQIDCNGATWLGMRVAGWTWEEDAFSPDQVPRDNAVRCYADHWSTGPHNAERLYRESDVAALLSKLQTTGPHAQQPLSLSKAMRSQPDKVVVLSRTVRRDDVLLEAVQFILKTFKADEAQGFRSRDRQFAISILEEALKSHPASKED